MSVIQDDYEDPMINVDRAYRHRLVICAGQSSTMTLETDASNDTRQKKMDLDNQEQPKAVSMQVKPGH